MTRKEISRHVGISEKTLTRWFGELGILKVDGKKTRQPVFSRDKIVDYIKKFYETAGRPPTYSELELNDGVTAPNDNQVYRSVKKYPDFLHSIGMESHSDRIVKTCKYHRVKVRKLGLHRLRFKIFQRDNFRCQYCGRSAKDGAILHVDHVYPASKGGMFSPGNLVTACFDCNIGKSDLLLDYSAGKMAG